MQVEPKIEKRHEAEAELKVATKERQQVEGELEVVQAKLDEMQAKFDAAMAQKQALEEDAAATQRKMDAANALITALGGEEVRWTQQSKLFDDTISRLIGDCAIASSFVSYLGPFNKVRLGVGWDGVGWRGWAVASASSCERVWGRAG